MTLIQINRRCAALARLCRHLIPIKDGRLTFGASSAIPTESCGHVGEEPSCLDEPTSAALARSRPIGFAG